VRLNSQIESTTMKSKEKTSAGEYLAFVLGDE
jgi:hypothetical protein